MSIRLTLLCHASTDALRAARFASDEALDAAGERKTEALVGKLPRTNRCLASPALRARQTATILGLLPSIEPALRDCDYGRWMGRALDEVSTMEPEATKQWLDDPAAAPHGGESLCDVLHRIAGWLDGLADERGQILAITHAAVIRAAIVHAMGAPAPAFWRIDVGPLSRTDLHRNDGRWTLRSVNCGVLQDDRT
jgi:broad specificity phosphatase PhoE